MRSLRGPTRAASKRPVRRLLTTALVIAAFALSLTGLAAADRNPDPGPPTLPVDALVVQDQLHGTTPQQMADALIGAGVTISNVVYIGTPNSGGLFHDTGPGSVVGFDSGVVMGSGSVQTAPPHDTNCNKGVEGPNLCDGNTTVNATPGDIDLNAFSGKTTFDAAVLEFDFVPQFSTVQFNYVFTSDEYNEYSNTQFNDTFAFLINGVNCALVPGTTDPVGVNTINGGNPYGVNAQHPEFFRNNDLSDGGGSIDTEMDGLTTVLTCSANVNAGVTNHMKLAIADASDLVLDSNVFIQGGSFISGTQVTTTLTGGGQSGASITVPSGTSVTDQATLQGVNAPHATGTVTYTVYSDSTCMTVFASGGTKVVTNGTVPPSDPVTFVAAGSYYWIAAYSGDAANNPSASACGAEVVTVTVGPPATLVLTPKTATNVAGNQHCVHATVRDANGAPTPNQPVDFTVSGANTASGTVSTDASGVATFCYTGTHAGSDTIVATAENGTKPTDTATKTWTAAAPASLVLTPKVAANVVGSTHTVTATVRDAFGNPTPGVTVVFSVSGANTASGTGTTNASGQATFTYSGTHFGADAITAFADTNGNGTLDLTEPSDHAAKAWTLATLDHFKCYKAGAKDGGDNHGGGNHGYFDSQGRSDDHSSKTVVTLKDQFGTSTVVVGAPSLLCNPVDKNGEGIVTPAAHLVGFKISPVSSKGDDYSSKWSDGGSSSSKLYVEVKNQFGTQTLKVGAPKLLLAPASKALGSAVPGPVPITVNHFQCYGMSGKAFKPAPVVSLSDQFGKESVVVGGATMLCNPADKNGEGIGPVGGPAHLVCYAIKGKSRGDDDEDRRSSKLAVTVRDQFGTQVLSVDGRDSLCVPSDKRVVPAPPRGGDDD
jgi:hypothetical protein